VTGCILAAVITHIHLILMAGDSPTLKQRLDDRQTKLTYNATDDNTSVR